jgi:protein ImuA
VPERVPDRRAKLDRLRDQIARLEGEGAGQVRARARLSVPDASAPGIAAHDDPLAAFRAQAGLHDLRPDNYLDAPAAYGFAVRWLAKLPSDRALVWVRARGDGRLDFGAPCLDGLAGLGLDPARLIRVEARAGADALWAMEEALTAGAFVLGEAGLARGYDLTASRRLHRAARESGGQALVVRAHDADGTSAALTRWRVASVPGAAAPWRGAGGLPGLGSLRLRAVLERRRGGAPAAFEMEWEDDALRSLEPAALADRAPQALAG